MTSPVCAMNIFRRPDRDAVADAVCLRQCADGTVALTGRVPPCTAIDQPRPVPIAAGAVLVSSAVFGVLSGGALLGRGATDGVGGVLAASIAVGIASVGGAMLIRGGIRRSRGLR